jgi:putative FmdB family regulatory protein
VQSTASLSQGAASTGEAHALSWPQTRPLSPNPPPTPMPLYEYVCRKCHKKFAEVLTIKEHDTKKLHCPKCQSTNLEKVIEPFFAKTASKTRG